MEFALDNTGSPQHDWRAALALAGRARMATQIQAQNAMPQHLVSAN